MTADKKLKAYIDRVLRLKEEQDTLGDDIREVYAEAKGEGYDKTVMGKLVAHLRKVQKAGESVVSEQEMVFDTYLSAYYRASGTAVATHTHEENYDRETGEVFGDDVSAKLVATVATGMQTEIGRKALVKALDIMIEREEEEARRSDLGLNILTKHEDIRTAPETADEMDRSTKSSFAARSGEAENARKAIPARPEDGSVTHAGAGEIPATHSEKATVASQGEATAPTSDERVSLPVDDRSDAAANAGGDHVDGNALRVPTSNTGEGAANTALPAERPRSALRPHCRNPGDNCGGFGSTHCHNCLKARQEEAA
jgi:uncharacterized protein (UPF0335 family)